MERNPAQGINGWTQEINSRTCDETWGCMLGSREVMPAGRTARRHFLKLITRIEPVQIIRYQELPGLA
ncbi:MAG: hypothetical protein OSB38_41540, partial [Paraburkholderia fungorum]|nr:hypothetical protein [Paraburkholderia fungorum]